MGNFLSQGGIAENQAFLGYAQKSADLRLSASKDTLTCWMGWHFYFTQVLIGLAFGPGLTSLSVLTFMGYSRRLRGPLPIQIAMFLVSIAGWWILLHGSMARRRVVFDFVNGRVTFSSRFFTRWEHVVELKNVREIVTSPIVRQISDASSPCREDLVNCYRLGLTTNDGRLVYVLETTQQEAIEQICQAVSRGTADQIEVVQRKGRVAREVLLHRPKTVPSDVLPATRGRWWGWPAFCVAGLGLIAATVTGVIICRCMIAQQWPTTDATVIESRLLSEMRQDPNREVATLVEQAIVRYQYRVGGKDFQAKNISFDSRQPRQSLARYPMGSTVLVWYKSTDPTQAVLDPAISSRTKCLFGVGLVVVGAYVVFVWRLCVSRRRQNLVVQLSAQGETAASQT